MPRARWRPRYVATSSRVWATTPSPRSTPAISSCLATTLRKAEGHRQVAGESHAKRISNYALHQFVKDDGGEPVNKYGLETTPFAGVKQKKLFRPISERPHLGRRNRRRMAGDRRVRMSGSMALKPMFYTGLRVEKLRSAGNVGAERGTMTRDELVGGQVQDTAGRWCGDALALNQAGQEGRLRIQCSLVRWCQAHQWLVCIKVARAAAEGIGAKTNWYAASCERTCRGSGSIRR